MGAQCNQIASASNFCNQTTRNLIEYLCICFNICFSFVSGLVSLDRLSEQNQEAINRKMGTA